MNHSLNTTKPTRGIYAGGAPSGWTDTSASPLETETAAGPKEVHVVAGALISCSGIWDEDQGITLTIARDADDHQEIGGLSLPQAAQLVASILTILRTVEDA